MNAATQLGLLVGVAGVVSTVLGARALDRCLSERARTFVAMVRHGAEHGLRLLPRDGAEVGEDFSARQLPIALAEGDEVRVYRDRDSGEVVHAYRQAPVIMASCVLGLGFLLLLWMLALLFVGRFGTRSSGTEFEYLSSSSALWLGLLSIGMLWVGLLGVVAIVQILLDLPGSVRITGTVLRHEEEGGRRRSYVPLVEYVHEDRTRTVWGSSRLFEPVPGDPIRVRVSARSPHEAVPTSPLVLCRVMLLLSCAAAGVTILGALTASTLE